MFQSPVSKMVAFRLSMFTRLWAKTQTQQRTGSTDQHLMWICRWCGCPKPDRFHGRSGLVHRFEAIWLNWLQYGNMLLWVDLHRWTSPTILPILSVQFVLRSWVTVLWSDHLIDQMMAETARHNVSDRFAGLRTNQGVCRYGMRTNHGVCFLLWYRSNSCNSWEATLLIMGKFKMVGCARLFTHNKAALFHHSNRRGSVCSRQHFTSFHSIWCRNCKPCKQHSMPMSLYLTQTCNSDSWICPADLWHQLSISQNQSKALAVFLEVSCNLFAKIRGQFRSVWLQLQYLMPSQIVASQHQSACVTCEDQLQNQILTKGL